MRWSRVGSSVDTVWRVIGVAVGALTLALLIAGYQSRASADGGDEVVGSWFATATPTSAPLPPLKTLLTLSRDGTATEAHRSFLTASPLGPLLATAGHGAWQRNGQHTVAVTLVLIYQGAPNHPTAPGDVLATETVRFVLSPASGGTRLSGTLIDEIDDLDGNVVFQGPGTFEGTRISAAP